jgi:hypothetical protein
LGHDLGLEQQKAGMDSHVASSDFGEQGKKKAALDVGDTALVSGMMVHHLHQGGVSWAHFYDVLGDSC